MELGSVTLVPELDGSKVAEGVSVKRCRLAHDIAGNRSLAYKIVQMAEGENLEKNSLLCCG